MEFVGHQFDDDLNVAKIFRARRGRSVYRVRVTNLSASRAFSHQLDAFFGVQNLFGKLYT